MNKTRSSGEIKAHIRKDGDVLWLVIDRQDGSTAHPILEDEIEAIMVGCKEYLRSLNI